MVLCEGCRFKSSEDGGRLVLWDDVRFGLLETDEVIREVSKGKGRMPWGSGGLMNWG